MKPFGLTTSQSSPTSLHRALIKMQIRTWSRLRGRCARHQPDEGLPRDGFPFILGFTVYESFEGAAVAASGIVNMPASGEKVLGGHVVLAVGYDDSKWAFIIRNSWGTDWGLKGYSWMPYEYLQEPKLSSDFWTVHSVGGQK